MSKKKVFTVEMVQAPKVLHHSQTYYGIMDFLGAYGALTLILFGLLSYVFDLYT